MSQANNEIVIEKGLDFNHSFKLSINEVVGKANGLLVFGHWLAALSFDYLVLLAGFMIAYQFGWVAYPLSLLFLGIGQHRLAILAHDGAHGLLVKNKQVSEWITQILCFWPLMTDIRSYKRFHWEHHKNTGNDISDPELLLKQDRYHLPMTYSKLFSGFLLDCLGRSIVEFIQVSSYMSKKGNPVWALSFLLMSLSFCFYINHVEFFILFILSKPTTFWAVFRLRIYTEHVGVDDTHRIHLSWWQRALFSPHNAWMHWEHHMHPQVPFWKLPEIRAQYKHIPIITFDELIHLGEVHQSEKIAIA
jgi:fatty acid desaturase